MLERYHHGFHVLICHCYHSGSNKCCNKNKNNNDNGHNNNNQCRVPQVPPGNAKEFFTESEELAPCNNFSLMDERLQYNFADCDEDL